MTITQETAEKMLGALYSALNIEGPATVGGESPCFEGLNVPWHFNEVREAIKAAESEGVRAL